MAEAVSQGKRFVAPPGYTQIPNALLDEMPEITTLGEMKVVMAIARRTFGWGIEERRLSLTEIQSLTGLSRQSAQKGVEAGLARGALARRREGHGFVYGIPMATAKNVGSSPVTEESTSATSRVQNLDSAHIGVNKTLRGKEKHPAASPHEGAKKRDTSKKGARFVPAPNDPADAVIVELYELWLSSTTQPERTVLTNHRASQCRARMREQAEGVDRDEALTVARAQMIEGLEGWFGSDWHKANQAFDWETFFRSRKKVEMFRGRNVAASNGAAERFSAYDAAIENGAKA